MLDVLAVRQWCTDTGRARTIQLGDEIGQVKVPMRSGKSAPGRGTNTSSSIPDHGKVPVVGGQLDEFLRIVLDCLAQGSPSRVRRAGAHTLGERRRG